MQEMRVGSLDLEEPLGKETATHSTILAWSIPGTEELDGLPSVGSHRVRHDWSALAAAAAAEIISYSVAQLFLIPWTVTPQASLSFTISWSLLKLTSIESVIPSHHLILCQLLLLLPLVFSASNSFPMSWLFASDAQRIETSSSASVLPMNFRVDFH